MPLNYSKAFAIEFHNNEYEVHEGGQTEVARKPGVIASIAVIRSQPQFLELAIEIDIAEEDGTRRVQRLVGYSGSYTIWWKGTENAT
jgi:hypothetical protein